MNLQIIHSEGCYGSLGIVVGLCVHAIVTHESVAGVNSKFSLLEVLGVTVFSFVQRCFSVVGGKHTE